MSVRWRSRPEISRRWSGGDHRCDLRTGLHGRRWAARLASAEAAATKALSLAPGHATAHLLLGVIQIFTDRGAEGIAECERALALDRNLADAHAWIGHGKYVTGNAAETEAHINEALRLSPRDTFAFRWMRILGLPSSSSKRKRKRPRGCGVALRRTAINRLRISCSVPSLRSWAGPARRRPPRRQDSRSIPASPSTASVRAIQRQSALPCRACAPLRWPADGRGAGAIGLQAFLWIRLMSRAAQAIERRCLQAEDLQGKICCSDQVLLKLTPTGH